MPGDNADRFRWLQREPEVPWIDRIRPFEPFSGYADITSLGHFDFQFYGSAVERTYSAPAALLF
jgi:hypothetical protein